VPVIDNELLDVVKLAMKKMVGTWNDDHRQILWACLALWVFQS
jgi:hypothetical protein